jgi:hypothetical protein
MKTSIKMFITVAAISLYGMNLKAQNTITEKGIYLNEQDFKNNKLSYVLTNTDKLQLNEFLNGKNVSLTYQGKKIKLAKSDIFGYRLNGENFRFYHNEAYKIIDTAGFLLYSHPKLTQQGKGYKPVDEFFYSVNTAQPVLALTIHSLWDSFPENTAFRYSLQSNFSTDGDLMTYDRAANKYKVKYLYFQQKQVLSATK